MRRTLNRLLLGLSFCAAPIANAQERHLRTYTLERALPEQVAPVLSAQLSPESSVTPFRQQLILNVTDSEYRTVTELLKTLDAAPRSLLISVRKQEQQSQRRERYGIDGRIGNDNVQIQSGSRQRREETRVTIDQGSARGNSDATQTVRAVEGMNAYIAAGSIVPIRSAYGERQLTPIETGFYANARIVGDEVIVDIDQRDDRLQQRGIATQNLQTQVRGRVGEWISLGGISEQRSAGANSYTNYRSDSSSMLAGIEIKIEHTD